MVGLDISKLTSKQTELLEKFRKNVSDVIRPQHDDYYLLRWLKARNFDLRKAENMLRNSLVWREKVGADTILEDWKPPEVLEQYWPGGHCGYDKEGSPIWIYNMGHIDLKGILQSAKKDDIIKYNVRRMEICERLCKEQSQKLGRRVDGVVQIADVGGFHLRLLFVPGIDAFSEVMSMFETNYPEQLKASYIINAPRVFPVLFSFIRPFMSEETKQKVHVLGSDWKEKLVEVIEPDQLPVYWGGTQRDSDGDEFCRSKVCVGGEVPSSYYLGNHILSDRHRMTNILVLQGENWPLQYHIKYPGTVIRWVFQTEGHDIGFGVFRKTVDSKGHQKVKDMEALMPTRRFNSHVCPEDGHVTCQIPGTYVLRFDNSYSWMKSKEVHYLIEVHEPDQEILEDTNDHGNSKYQGKEENLEIHYNPDSRVLSTGIGHDSEMTRL